MTLEVRIRGRKCGLILTSRSAETDEISQNQELERLKIDNKNIFYSQETFIKLSRSHLGEKLHTLISTR